MSLIPTIGLPKGRSGQFIVDSVADGYEAFALAKASAETAPDGPIVFVARDGQRLPAIAETLAFADPGLPVLELPAWDCLPYDRVSPGSDAAARRQPEEFDVEAGWTRLRELLAHGEEAVA